MYSRPRPKRHLPQSPLTHKYFTRSKKTSRSGQNATTVEVDEQPPTTTAAVAAKSTVVEEQPFDELEVPRKGMPGFPDFSFDLDPQDISQDEIYGFRLPLKRDDEEEAEAMDDETEEEAADAEEEEDQQTLDDDDIEEGGEDQGGKAEGEEAAMLEEDGQRGEEKEQEDDEEQTQGSKEEGEISTERQSSAEEGEWSVEDGELDDDEEKEEIEDEEKAEKKNKEAEEEEDLEKEEEAEEEEDLEEDEEQTQGSREEGEISAERQSSAEEGECSMEDGELDDDEGEEEEEEENDDAEKAEKKEEEAEEEEDSAEDEQISEEDESEEDEPEIVKKAGGKKKHVDELRCEVLFEQLKLEEEKMPDVNTAFEPTPKHFGVELTDYQKGGLKWMIWREQGQSVPSLRGKGGILADEQGLGKTVSAVALMLKTKNQWNEQQKHKGANKNDNFRVGRHDLIKSNATLVVCPNNLIEQWASMASKMAPDLWQMEIPKGKQESTAKEIAKYDLVIINYENLVAKFRQKQWEGTSKKNCKGHFDIPSVPDSALAKIQWKRVILDEAHVIRNYDSLVSKACRRLKAQHRWALTGTPVHKGSEDFFSLIRFLRLDPFFHECDELKKKGQSVWRRFKKFEVRLKLLARVIMLRNTKESVNQRALANGLRDGMPIFKKPTIVTHEVKPKGIERDLQEEINTIAAEYYSEGWYARVLEEEFDSFIVPDDYEEDDDDEDEWKSKELAPQEEQQQKNPYPADSWLAQLWEFFYTLRNPLKLLLRLRQICIHFALIRKSNYIERLIAEKPECAHLFEKDRPSSRINAIIEWTKKILADVDDDKCIIMSEWAEVLDIIRHNLMDARIQHLVVHGKVNLNQRQTLLRRFNEEAYVRVLLITTKVGSEGLNLQVANHLIIVEPQWNPQVEKQAESRIDRMGQAKEVFIHRFVANGVEKRILDVQKRKLAAADHILKRELKYVNNKGKKKKPAAATPKLQKDDMNYIITGRMNNKQ